MATPPGGLEADVLVVSNFDDLRSKRAHVPGRIVLFDVAYTTYAETMSYRTGGARLAAEYGAAAVLVRSVGPIGLRTAHTGSVNYAPGPQIPRRRLPSKTPTASPGSPPGGVSRALRPADTWADVAALGRDRRP